MARVHLLQEYLRDKGIQSLVDTYHILIKRHKTYPNLTLFKYNMIESPMGEPIVQVCRGIILDESCDWAVVSYGYEKFFCAEEGHAAKIDWSTATVYEKADGSLCLLYWYDNKWNVSSSGLPDASGNINGGFIYGTFAELFWETWKTLGYDLPKDRDCCYMFELCTKHNRVIVQHKDSHIMLHGARNLRTFEELTPEPVAAANHWECVRSYPLTTWEECISAAKSLDPLVNEGYVVRDASFNRVKLKSPQYVALSHLKDGMSVRRLLEIVRIGETSEVLAAFPEWKMEFQEIEEKYNTFVFEVSSFYDTVKSIENQKEFALIATKKPWYGALFSVRSKKSPTFKHYFSEVQITSLESWLGLSVKPLYTGTAE